MPREPQGVHYGTKIFYFESSQSAIVRSFHKRKNWPQFKKNDVDDTYKGSLLAQCILVYSASLSIFTVNVVAV